MASALLQGDRLAALGADAALLAGGQVPEVGDVERGDDDDLGVDGPPEGGGQSELDRGGQPPSRAIECLLLDVQEAAVLLGDGRGQQPERPH